MLYIGPGGWEVRFRVFVAAESYGTEGYIYIPPDPLNLQPLRPRPRSRPPLRTGTRVARIRLYTTSPGDAPCVSGRRDRANLTASPDAGPVATRAPRRERAREGRRSRS